MSFKMMLSDWSDGKYNSYTRVLILFHLFLSKERNLNYYYVEEIIFNRHILVLL